MAMAVDSRQQISMGGMYDHMRYSQPQFTNPWTATNQAGQIYPQQQLPPVSSGYDEKVSRNPQLPQTYQMTPTSGPQMSPNHAFATGYDQASTLDIGQRSYAQDFSIPAVSQPGYPATSAPQFAGSYSQSGYPFAQDASRPAFTQRAPQVGRENFNEALDASRGLIGMSSQTDLTPRNIYGADTNRQSQDAYGFPTTHSAHSSISSASTYPSYYNSSINGSIAGSVDGSVTDYSSAGEEVIGSRTLPRPTGYMNGSIPPAASSMMSQFNSKVAPNTQKKHKCKICDKRFTRPSSLQTHMYSHTGEKPFACDAEGCGRHFSVVSNLRRHKKVHRGENDHPSPEDE